MSALRVGVIGLGSFGARVAMRLLWNGYPGLTVYDVIDIATRVFTNDFGGMPAGSPKMVSQACDVVLTALPSAEELRTVCFGWEGLAKGFPEGGTIVDLGTTDPVETTAIAAELKARNIDFLDAPAIGTRDDAKAGALTIPVGGDEAVVERCRPVLETLGRKIVHTGAAGSAQAARILAEYLKAARLLAASEAMRLAGRFGFEAGALLAASEAMGDGAALDRVLREEVASRRFESGTPLGLLRRNVEIAGRLSESAEIRSPLLAATRQALAEAETKIGWGADQTELICWLESLPSAALASEAPAKPAEGATVSEDIARV